MTELLHEQDLVIGKLGHKHATYETLVGTGAGNPKEPFADRAQGFFCVVRHPLRWHESWYKYQCGRGWPDWGQQGNLEKWHAMCDLNACKAPEFGAFMAAVNKTVPGYVSQLYARYAGGSKAHVLRNETVAEDFIALASETGLEINANVVRAAPRQGVSPPQEIYWDPCILRETISNERPAFRRFGYQEEIPVSS